MGFDNTVTIVGNVTRDPELRFAQSGMAITEFGVAWNRRRQDQEDEVSFFDITCFRQLAENVAESVRKGARVVVYGTLQQRSWETDHGERRSRVSIIADDVAPSLRWATAAITRNERSGDYRGDGGRPDGGRGGGGGRGGYRGDSYRGGSAPRSEERSQRSDEAPAAVAATDEEPF